MRGIYLLTTEHLENCLWFRDEEDFKVGMNYVAIQAACSTEVTVLTFILMSNHVHFLLNGRKKDVIAFVNQFKRRYSIYYRRRYGVKEFLRHNGLDVRLILQEDEEMERAFAYVQMNCVAANICAHPGQYPWGTGTTFFSQQGTRGKRLGDLSARERERLMHSECKGLPEEWRICEEGYVNPEEYVDVRTVEACFRTPNRMNYFLNNSSKAKKRIEMADDNLPAFRDQTILASLPDLCRSLFQKRSFDLLQADEQAELARQIRFRFSADPNQIARVCGISYPEAARLLDSI
ncbi:MAG: transposase [Bacteroidales bacterium]|nr:transposase [Bacteroidales bacterium]